MTLEPPAPPTAPAPAIRPTPPTPPRIDKGAFNHDDAPQVNRKVETPEDMARDAVAHGAGSLTKRKVERGDETQAPPPNQTVTIIPPDAPLIGTQSDYDKGQGVLREFKELDERETHATYSPTAQTSTEQAQPVTPRLNHQEEEHGAFYWLFTIVFVILATILFGKKFLYTEKRARVRTPFFDGLPDRRRAADKPKPVISNEPTRTKAQLDNAATDKRKAAADKIEPVTPPPTPVKLPPKQDDDKGKHFEVRV